MGIASDCARVKVNINAALAAIADKGVTVPDGSNSDALAELIASIQAGGGLPDGLSKIAYGTVTPSYGVSSVQIEHGLGVVPDFAILFAASVTSSGSYHTISTVVLYKNSASITYEYASGYPTSAVYKIGGIYTSSSTSSVLTGTTCKFLISSYKYNGSTTTAYFSTNPNCWIAGVFA